MSVTPIQSNGVDRAQIRQYFDRPRFRWPILFLLFGLALTAASIWASFGVPPALEHFVRDRARVLREQRHENAEGFELLANHGLPGFHQYFGDARATLACAGLVALTCLWLGVRIFRRLNIPDARSVDAWFQKDLESLQVRARIRLSLEDEELCTDPVVIVGPIWWQTKGIDLQEVRWVKDRDGFVRFNANSVTIIFLTAHKLSCYQCDFNRMRGVSVNDRDDEYHYQDVVSVSTFDDTTNYTLMNDQVMKHAQMFSLAVSSGDRIRVVVTSNDLIDLTGGTTIDTGLDACVKAIRKVLGEKKRLAA